jgi:hypothetical protein
MLEVFGLTVAIHLLLVIAQRKIPFFRRRSPLRDSELAHFNLTTQLATSFEFGYKLPPPRCDHALIDETSYRLTGVSGNQKRRSSACAELCLETPE